MRNYGLSYKYLLFSDFTALTVDVIARCAFGTKINVLDDPNDPFFNYVRKMSFDDVEPNWMFSAIRKWSK